MLARGLKVSAGVFVAGASALAGLIVLVESGLWARVLTGVAAIGLLGLALNNWQVLVRARILDRLWDDDDRRPRFAVDLTVTTPRDMEPLGVDDLDDLIDDLPYLGKVDCTFALRSARVIRLTMTGRKPERLDALGAAVRARLVEAGYTVEIEL